MSYPVIHFHVFYPVAGNTKRSNAKRQAIYNTINNTLLISVAIRGNNLKHAHQLLALYFREVVTITISFIKYQSNSGTVIISV